MRTAGVVNRAARYKGCATADPQYGHRHVRRAPIAAADSVAASPSTAVKVNVDPLPSSLTSVLMGLCDVSAGVCHRAAVAVATQNLVSWHGSRDEVPLRFIASMRPQPIELHLGLDTLGGHVEPDFARQRQDGRANRGIDSIGA